MPRTANETVPSQFRLERPILEDLDLIRAWLEKDRGGKQSRTDAVRFAAREAAKKIRKKSE